MKDYVPLFQAIRVLHNSKVQNIHKHQHLERIEFNKVTKIEESGQIDSLVPEL